MAARAEFHTKFRALDDAYQKSLVSMSTQALVDVAVKPTDAVYAKKEYALVEIGGGSDVTPVTPE